MVARTIGDTRIFGPMLEPRYYPVPRGHQYDLFIKTPPRDAAHHDYKSAGHLENRPRSNFAGGAFIPPTTIQIERAMEYIEDRTVGAPRARSRSFGCLQLFVLGYSKCDVIEYVHRGHVFAMCRRVVQLVLKGTWPREIMRQLRSEKILTFSAPGRAQSAAELHLNGF